MSTPIIHVHPSVAQTPVQQQLWLRPNMWMMTSGLLLIVLVGVGIFSSIQFDKIRKRLKFEQYKNRELQKKVKLALGTISKMERNPDLIHSREFNLDYLRMRMEEERFHTTILNQLKVKVKQKISVALRPKQAAQGMVGIASKPRQVDEMFDVEYRTGDALGAKKRVLFRIQIKLAKLPTQPTSVTISQIIDCIETFLRPDADHSTWQPTLQGRIAYMHWDQKAKPTPLLVLEQSRDGVNVTFRSTNRSVKPSPNQNANRATNQNANQADIGNNNQTAKHPAKQIANGNNNQTAKRTAKRAANGNNNQTAKRNSNHRAAR